MVRSKFSLVLALTLLLSVATGAEVPADTFRWDNVDRVVVVPDVHGAYPALVELLQTTGILDTSSRWIAGDTHLVSLGDLLDRGPESRRVMDLLMRLQSEAEAAGGRVHVVAGNHELMNLIGDLRYVSDEEFAAFSVDETDAMRPESPGDQTHPPGYYAHRRAFRSDGHYGRWLLTLPAVVVINDTAYAHGGLPPITSTMSLDALNREYRQTVARYMSLWRELVDMSLLPDDEADDAGMLAESALADAEQSACVQERMSECINVQQTRQLQEFVEVSASPLLSDDGPLWFRGAVYCREMFEKPALEAALGNLGARRVVVGHTTTPDARAHSLHDNQMVLLDTGMLTAYYKGRPAVLVSEPGREYVQYLEPKEQSQPIQDRYPLSYKLSDHRLYEILTSGDIETTGVVKGQPLSVTVSHNGDTIGAEFIPQDKDRVADRELAASRLDRLLGFDLVPTAVAREMEGQPGTLKLAYQHALSERERVDSGRPVGGWCSLNRQIQMMYVWDLLTANTGRTLDNVLYELPLWRLRVDAHGQAFGTGRRLPRGIQDKAIQLHPEVRDALKRLSMERIREQLGDLVDDKAIRALLKRRDALLKTL